MLKLENINAGYGDLKILHNISLTVNEGEVVTLVGGNGAGKTTLLRVISGFIPISCGSITFCGNDLTKLKTSERAMKGIAHIPQGRGILSKLTVKENLELGAFKKDLYSMINDGLKKAYNMFPILKERQTQIAGSLSGGEQQMLAIARALMMQPKLIIMDEPSLGLAPIIVEEVFSIISNVSKQGMSILIVEQNLIKALSVAQRGYVLENGHIVKKGLSSDLLNDDAVRKAYLGV